MTINQDDIAPEHARNYYIKHKSEFIRFVDAAVEISSKIGVRQTDLQRGWAAWLLMRLCVTGRTIERLVSEAPIREGEVHYIDHGSIASISRNIIDNATALLYFGDISISQEDWIVRKRVADIHDCVSRGDFFDLLDDKEEADKRDKILEILQNRLRSEPGFAKIDARRQKRLLDGDDMYVVSRSESAAAIGIGKKSMKAAYKYLSMQTHTMPMSFHRASMQKLYNGQNVHEMAVSGFALMHAGESIRVCCNRMISLFEDISSAIQAETKAVLENPSDSWNDQ